MRVKCAEARGCDDYAVVRLRLACVHEHIYTTVSCQRHIDLFRKDAPTVCHPCKTGPEPHRCLMLNVFRSPADA